MAREKIKYEGMEIYEWEPGDENPPEEGYKMAEYYASAIPTGTLYQELIQLIISGQIVPAAQKLLESLDHRTTMPECMAWIKLLKENKKFDIRANEPPKDMETLTIRGTYWVKPQEVKKKVGWFVIGERKEELITKKVDDKTTQSGEEWDNEAFKGISVKK